MKILCKIIFVEKLFSPGHYIIAALDGESVWRAYEHVPSNYYFLDHP